MRVDRARSALGARGFDMLDRTKEDEGAVPGHGTRPTIQS